MIVCHEYKYIFLKTAKTAGTSLEIALSRYCGPNDIITPISPKDQKIRKALGYPGPQNYCAPNADLKKLVKKHDRKKRYHNHMPARLAREFLGEEIWSTYYKFCFERNPWERVISSYYYRNQREPRPILAEFIESGTPHQLRRRGYDVYTVDGEIAVDRVCLYENLAGELKIIEEQLGLPGKLQLPRAKAQYRKDHRSYQEILDDEDVAKIGEIFRKEISLFGYG